MRHFKMDSRRGINSKRVSAARAEGESQNPTLSVALSSGVQ